jgi:myo-inositol-1-phosphate synthase
MDRTPVLSSKNVDFTLKPNSGAMPGIEKKATAEAIEVTYQSRFALFDEAENVSRPVIQEKTIKTDARVPKLGVMLVGLGGNNGSTFTAGVLANKHQLSWETKNGEMKANFFGSFTQSATTHVGFKFNEKTGELNDVFKPINSLLPMVNPVDFDICGWDISSANLYESCKRAHVLEPTLISQLKSELEQIKPMRAVLNPDYIASNQADRADNLLKGTNQECIDAIRADIQACKKRNDKVIVLWTANTEMFLLPEINALDDLEDRIKNNAPLPASVLYCVAAIQEGVLYLNGSPQNTFHPAVVEMADKNGAFLAGSDFKSGQTRFKTIMSDFLIGSGLRLASVVSYNHLGNNDGKNLSEDKTFRSKQISKAGVLDDAIKANSTLYPKGQDKIDHEVIIKYVPFVGDSKRAMDEYSSQIFMNGCNTITSYNVCEDSLLAVPLMFDMIVLGELFTRMNIDGEKLGPVLSYLSFFFKAPITNHDEYVINSFSRQRETLVNLLKVASGILPDDTTLLSFKF